ncbi:hypothetical protein [Nocardia australiensis]|uniref:hypothetical protein n=1 Tax=Nocardia australiensis TaxID=2887191 RepID=UPI001D1443A3|nr:hypothetical protein [Nocardia australiensis]
MAAQNEEDTPFGEQVQHRRGLLSAPPIGEITRGVVERLLNSQLPRQLDCTAVNLLRATVDTALHMAIRPSSDKEAAS